MSETALKQDDLPSTWALTSLGAVVDYGRATKAEPSQIADEDWVLELEDIEKDSSRLLQRLTFAQRQSKSTKNRFQAGDVLYGKLRPYLNKVLIADRPGYCTTEIVPIATGAQLDKRYLFYWLKHPAFLKYVEAESHGMSMPRLGTDTAKAAPFVLAPRNEQTRIADQLDKLLSRVQACNERIDAIPALLKRFRQVALTAALSGDLTNEWRETNEAVDARNLLKQILEDHQEAGGHAKGNAAAPTDGVHNLDSEAMPSNWTVATLRDLCEPGRPICYGILMPGPELSEGVPYIRVADFPGNRLNLNSIRMTSHEIDEQFKRSRLRPGDLLLSIRGTVGRIVETPTELSGANITQDTARLTIGPRVLRRYVYLALLADTTQKRMQRAVRGVAVKGINIGDVRALQIPFPPYEEQAEIVRRVEALFKLADRIEARYMVARGQAQRLTLLLLAKAFRGELVPQDPNDEPASVLLERIAAERVVTATQPRRRQPTAGRKPARAPKENAAMTKSRQDDDVQGKPYLAKHLRLLGGSASAEALFKASELPVADFYKQLAWEMAQGHLRDGKTVLELTDAA